MTELDQKNALEAARSALKRTLPWLDDRNLHAADDAVRAFLSALPSPAPVAEGEAVATLIKRAREMVRYPNIHFHYTDGAEVMSALADMVEVRPTPASPATIERGVEVKPLEWAPGMLGDKQFAHTPLGMMFVLFLDDGLFHLERHEGSGTTHSVWKTEAEAKSFANTKWTELSTLTLSPDNGREGGWSWRKLDVDIVLHALPPAEIFHAADVNPEGMDRKRVFNALGYLCRRGDIMRIGYGKFQRPPTTALTQEPAHGK